MRRKQLAGAEAFARVRHPQHGLLSPGNFMHGADDASMLGLSELAMVSALKIGDMVTAVVSPPIATAIEPVRGPLNDRRDLFGR